jgi:type II secretory pathway component PulF
MPVFSGSTSTSASSSPYNLAAFIRSFSISNKSGSALTAVVSVLYGSTNTEIIRTSIEAGETYVSPGNPITLAAERTIYVLVNGSCDYYFSIE